MKLQIKSLFVFGVLLLTFYRSAEAQETLRREGRYYVGEITKSFKVKKGGLLRIASIQGDVQVTAWDKDEVLVHEIRKMDVFTEGEAKEAMRQAEISYRQVGNTIEIGGETFHREWIKSFFDVKLPTDFNLDIDTRGGDLTVIDLGGSAELKTSGGDISLTNISGEVQAKTSGGDIEVKGAKKRLDLKTSGGDLELSDLEGPVYAKTSGGDIELICSKDLADLSTSGGSIRLSQVGGQVKAHTSGGDILVDGTTGPIEVHTSGGDIELRNIKGKAEAQTSGGDIDVRRVEGGIDAATSGGDIDLKGINGYIEAATSGGDIEAEMTLTDFSKDHHVNMRSSGGDLTLYLPAKLPATIEAVIQISDRGWEDYNIYSDFPLTYSENGGKEKDRERRSRWGRLIRSHGDINGGGDLIHLETTNGNIRIKKLP
ncbi:MAG: DUF4097 family beta strand repeat-containing protein [candidate division KSB1 bacterium]|nr:DUF4097 family beta strand repeat-containing protein [candidate division KSB1 bacterium]